MWKRPPSPTVSQIRACFQSLLDETITRDAADRWAAQWIAAGDPAVDDPDVWWALGLLCGVDLRHGPGEDLLHDQEQIRAWMNEFSERIAACG